MNPSPRFTFRLRGWDPSSDAESHVLAGFAADYMAEQYERRGTMPLPLITSPGDMTYFLRVPELGGEQNVGFVSITHSLVALALVYVAPAHRRRGICGSLLETFRRKRLETEYPFAVVPPVTPELVPLMDARGIGTTDVLAPTEADQAAVTETLAEVLDFAAQHTAEMERACVHRGASPSACAECTYGAAHRWARYRVMQQRAEALGEPA